MNFNKVFELTIDVLATAGVMGLAVLIIARILAPRLPEIFATFRAWEGMLFR